jgi:hypothetical protein
MKDLELQKEFSAVKKLDWNLAKQSILLNPTPDPETIKKIQTDSKHKKRCQYCGNKHKKGKEALTSLWKALFLVYVDCADKLFVTWIKSSIFRIVADRGH